MLILHLLSAGTGMLLSLLLVFSEVSLSPYRGYDRMKLSAYMFNTPVSLGTQAAPQSHMSIVEHTDSTFSSTLAARPPDAHTLLVGSVAVSSSLHVKTSRAFTSLEMAFLCVKDDPSGVDLDSGDVYPHFAAARLRADFLASSTAAKSTPATIDSPTSRSSTQCSNTTTQLFVGVACTAVSIVFWVLTTSSILSSRADCAVIDLDAVSPEAKAAFVDDIKVARKKSKMSLARYVSVTRSAQEDTPTTVVDITLPRSTSTRLHPDESTTTPSATTVVGITERYAVTKDAALFTQLSKTLNESSAAIPAEKRAVVHGASQQVLNVNNNNSDHKDDGNGSSTFSKATIQACPEAIQMKVQNQTIKITQRPKLSPLQVEKPIRLANVESKEAQKAALIDVSAMIKEVLQAQLKLQTTSETPPKAPPTPRTMTSTLRKTAPVFIPRSMASVPHPAPANPPLKASALLPEATIPRLNAQASRFSPRRHWTLGDLERFARSPQATTTPSTMSPLAPLKGKGIRASSPATVSSTSATSAAARAQASQATVGLGLDILSEEVVAVDAPEVKKKKKTRRGGVRAKAKKAKKSFHEMQKAKFTANQENLDDTDDSDHSSNSKNEQTQPCCRTNYGWRSARARVIRKRAA